MAASYPSPDTLRLPVETYQVDGHRFGKRVRSRWILWARHLGDDLVLDPHTKIHAIGDGVVVWSEVRVGSKDHPNWGGLVVIGHQHKETGEAFFSLYGHLEQLTVDEGDQVRRGDELGQVANGNSPENGWWAIPHLHFGVYVGPWTDQVLPGYVRPFEGRTRFSWWRNPLEFISLYNGRKDMLVAAADTAQAKSNGS